MLKRVKEKIQLAVLYMLPNVLDKQYALAVSQHDNKAARFIAEIGGVIKSGQSIQNTTNVVQPVSYQGDDDEEFQQRFDRAMKERGINPEER